MSLLRQLPELIEESREFYEEAYPARLSASEKSGDDGNMLALCDNIGFAKFLVAKGYRNKVQTIYMDPPFMSGSDYTAKVQGPDGKKILQPAYTDTWKHDEEGYIRMLCASLWAAKDLLSDTGSVFLHLDWHFVHYMKVAMDEIFGRENFVNEIIWQYKSGGSTKKHFARKHDTILMYSGSGDHYISIPKEKSYNRDGKPYRFKGVDEFEDEAGWYTMVNMKDVWALDMVGRTSAERTGYATQKPESLLERIVESSSREGDICVDLFCGSGTLPVVCARTGRRFMACDIGRLAACVTKKRLYENDASFTYYRSDERGKAEIIAETESRDDGKTVSIKGYIPDLETVTLNEKDAPSFMSMTVEDALAMIETVSIDDDFDGKVHHQTAYSVRDKNGGPKLSFPVGSGSDISIIVTDIFGNETSTVVSGK